MAYVSVKRFSIEGVDTLVPMLDEAIVRGACAGARQIVIGMAHRGRLNVLANTLGKSYEQIFREFEGDIDPDRVAAIVQRARADGADRIAFGDTTGMATPRRVRDLLSAVRPDLLHFHDTRGTGLANILTALDLGVSEFDASAGGIGGCPYAPGASGNVATEEVVHMLHDMGINTGIDLDRLIETAELAEKLLGRTLPSGVLRAGPRTRLV